MPRYVKTWRNRVDGGLNFLEELTAIPKPKRDNWVESQIDHYTTVVRKLLSQTPSGCQLMKKGFEKRLKNL